MSQKAENQNKKYKHSPALNASIMLVLLSVVLLITLAMFTSFDEVTNRFEAGKVDIVLEEHHWKPANGREIVPNTFLEKDPSVRNKEEMVNTYVFLEVTVPYDDDPNLIIEKAYQNYNDDSSNKAGERVYPAANATNNLKVPYYKFVATGERITTPSYSTTRTPGINYDGGYNWEQKVNESRWYLLPGYPIDNMGSKTFTYVYAYVQTRENPGVDGETVALEPLLAGGQTTIPLFNEIYLLNFREREVTDEVPTAFPDPQRDYNIKINAYGIQAEFLTSDSGTTNNPGTVWKMLKPSYDSTHRPGDP